MLRPRVSKRSRVAAGFALPPALAVGDVGIGYFTLALPIVVAALVLAIPLGPTAGARCL